MLYRLQNIATLAKYSAVFVLLAVGAHAVQGENIILFIGDGMGPQQVLAAHYYNGGPLSFEGLPHQAICTTHSASSAITDSAAGATAIATGVKVNNGVISLAIPGDGHELETLLEYYQGRGKKVGLITTAYLTHATPAGFGAHEPDRNNYAQIGAELLNQTRPNILFGGGGNGLDPTSTAAAGYVVATATAGFNALNLSADHLAGQFGTTYLPYEEAHLAKGDYPYPHLTDMVTKALAALGSDPDGFFLMVEAGRIDHACHSNWLPEAVQETLELSRAVKAALDWAAGQTDTTILVTADHETGGLTVTADNGAGNYPSVMWSGTDHTAARVPVYGWGPNSDQVNGVLDNTELHTILAGKRIPVTVALVPAGSMWKYHDNGADLGVAWRQPGYVEDGTWEAGPAELGYGDNDEATVVSYGPDAAQKHVTTYFRHTFDVPDVTAISQPTLQLLRDDGAVVYLNGTEIARYSMPSTFDYLTYALTAADYPWDPPIAVPTGLLVSGANVLAVEIHQCSPTSSDLSLDLVLVAEQVLPGAAPDLPVLLAPADGAGGVGTPPGVAVQVSDPDGGPLAVTFYGRENVPAEPFTLVVLPDTQNYVASSTYAAIFTQQTQWIVENCGALNIAAVSHEGDIVNAYNSTTEWDRANTSLTILDDFGLPYGLLPGNHDAPTTDYNRYFPPTRYSSTAWYGGNYPTGQNDNSFILFSGGGLDFILLQLQHRPDTAAIDWADTVLKSYADRRAIITTHAFLDETAARTVDLTDSTQYIWDDLVVPNPNVWFVLCGHTDGEARRTDTVNGHDVHQLLADYQALANGGNGWLRIMRFVPVDNRVDVLTYSPYLDLFQVDADSEFSLSFPMGGFESLGTYSGVPSGQTVSHTWSEAAGDADYQWYVTVTDPTGCSTQSAIWTFNTAVTDTTPPVISSVTVAEVTDRSAVVTWTTDEPADSNVDYGTTPSYGQWVHSPDLVTGHSVELTGLDAGTTYYFVVSSADATGNAAACLQVTFETAEPNRPPVANDLNVYTPEDTQSVITLTATDHEGDPLYFHVTVQPEHGTLAGTAPHLTYTPALNYAGPDSFDYVANDGRADSSPATVWITVTPVNDAPSAPVLSATAGDSVVSLSWTASGDPEGTAVSYEVWRSPNGQTYDLLIAGLTELAYSDDTLENGVQYYYAVRALDADGGYAESNFLSATAVAVDCNAYVIQNPTVVYGAVTGDYQALHPDAIGAVQTITEQKVALNGLLDVEYMLQTSADPSQIRSVVLVLYADVGSWDDGWRMQLWTDNAWTDITSFIDPGGYYAAADPDGCVDASGLIRVRFTDSAAIRKETLNGIAIEHLYAAIETGPIANRPPIAIDDSASTPVDTSVVIDLLDNDIDPDGDLLIISEVSNTTDKGGELLDHGNGTVTYTPFLGFSGTDTFAYTASDGDLTASATVTVTVTVKPAPGETIVHLAAIDMGLNPAGKNWKATATVTVVDQVNGPAIGATVYGDWLFDGVLLQTGAIAVADAAGVAGFSSVPVKTRSGTFTFRVSDVRLTDAAYEPGLNAETEHSIAVP